jgi:Fe-S-cluster containining protein
MHPAAAAYRDALGRLDRWFLAAKERHPVIPCRQGCSACCYGPFDISVADALLLREGMATLPEAERELVRKQGRSLHAHMRQMAPAWHPPWDLETLGEEAFDAITEALTDQPCPLLDDAGACRLYAYRPLVCRMMGLPMMTAGGFTLENTCPIQERFPGYATLDPQLFDLEAFEADETACLEGAAAALFDSPLYRDYETTISVVAAE